MITKALSPITFQLDLFKTWKIHPVFHTALLTLYRQIKEHRLDFFPPLSEPLPNNSEELEYEVEAILNH